MLQPSAVINYVRPYLSNIYDDRYAGPADIWNPNKGFLVQSTNPESYSLNFPTTGAHNLYFDLLITGIEPEELTWEPVTHEGITATVTNVVPNDYWIPYEDGGQVVARVKLIGPEARNQWYNPHPNPIAKPKLPQTFELVGRDINTNDEVVKYGFVLRQWFVSRGHTWRDYSDYSAWCDSLGYRMPRVRDLTNAKCGVRGDMVFFPCINGINSAMPSSDWNGYRRHIGAGFFTEWGSVGIYADSGFSENSMTSDGSASSKFHVNTYEGDVLLSDGPAYGVCTTP